MWWVYKTTFAWNSQNGTTHARSDLGSPGALPRLQASRPLTLLKQSLSLTTLTCFLKQLGHILMWFRRMLNVRKSKTNTYDETKCSKEKKKNHRKWSFFKMFKLYDDDLLSIEKWSETHQNTLHMILSRFDLFSTFQIFHKSTIFGKSNGVAFLFRRSFEWRQWIHSKCQVSQ